MTKNQYSRRAAGQASHTSLSTISMLILASTGALAVYLTFHGLLLLTFLLSAAIVISFPNQILALYQQVERRMVANRTSGQLVPLVATVGVLSLFFIVSAAEPAHAQFFVNAQTWMTGAFPGAGAFVPVVFNVLRGVFIIYVGIAIVRVIVAARNDDDWTTLARTPLIVILALVIGNLIVDRIIATA